MLFTVTFSDHWKSRIRFCFVLKKGYCSFFFKLCRPQVFCLGKLHVIHCYLLWSPKIRNWVFRPQKLNFQFVLTWKHLKNIKENSINPFSTPITLKTEFKKLSNLLFPACSEGNTTIIELPFQDEPFNIKISLFCYRNVANRTLSLLSLSLQRLSLASPKIQGMKN